MFTGLVEEVGRLTRRSTQGNNVSVIVESAVVHQDSRPGDSIAINGVCVTVTSISEIGFSADLSAETLKRTTLGSLALGTRINLERALQLSSRLAGHIVLGHVDAVGQVCQIRKLPGVIDLEISFPSGLSKMVVEKGSLAVDGISLTIARAEPIGRAAFAIIPSTWENTSLSDYRSGTVVNVEMDIIAKHIVRLANGYPDSGRWRPALY